LAIGLEPDVFKVFLLGDAVAVEKKGQRTPAGYYDLGQMIADLLGSGAEVRVCGTCTGARGLKSEEFEFPIPASREDKTRIDFIGGRTRHVRNRS